MVYTLSFIYYSHPLFAVFFPHRQLSAMMQMTESDFVTLDHFKPFCSKHEELMLPVLSVQEKLRTAAMGLPFWDELSKRHIKLLHGHTMPISELMVLVSEFVC